MESKSHAAISLAVAAGALVLTAPPIPPLAAFAIALAAGVGIDLDHFLLARWRTGNWDAVRRCLRDPTILFVDQGAIFEPGDVGALNRLLSHVVIGGVAVPAVWLWRPSVAGLVAAVLYAHVLADLIAGVRERIAVEREDASAETLRAAGRERSGDDSAGDESP